MTLAELSETTGVSVATIKYYLREGLLDPGDPVGPKKSEYGQGHVARIRLIRILREVGDVPIARIAEVVSALADANAPFHEVSGRAFHALGPHVALPSSARAQAARREVIDYIDEAGWVVDARAPAIDVLAEALLAVRTFWDPAATTAVFDRYRDMVDELSRGDLAMIPDPPDMATFVSQTAVGTVLWDRALIAVRRLALEDKSRRRFTGPVSASGGH